MAKLPSKENKATGIRLDADVYEAIKKYGDDRQWSFNKAIQNLAKAGLEEEYRKNPTSKPKKQDRPKK